MHCKKHNYYGEDRAIVMILIIVTSMIDTETNILTKFVRNQVS